MTNRNAVLLSALTSAIIFAILVAVMQMLPRQAVQAQAGTALAHRQVTVIGEGEVSGTPDTAHVTIGVETDAETTQEALAANNRQVEAMVQKLKEMEIDEQDIQTSNFNIHANYNSSGNRVTGYHVSNMVNVTIRDLQQAGELLDEVVQLGANRVYGITFSVDDPTALLEQARDAAMTNARTRAEQLAQSGGASVGQVIEITENIGSQPPRPMVLDRAMPEMEAGSAVPVEAGEQQFTVRVQATFALR